MINRRHIRMKVMQSVYAMQHSHNTDLEKEEKYLQFSVRKMLDLYVLNLNFIVEVQRLASIRISKAKTKVFATKEELNPNTKFLDNLVIKKLEESVSLDAYMELNNITTWRDEDKFVINMLNKLQESDFYMEYLNDEESSFKKDQRFVARFFKELIAPSDSLGDYFEGEVMSWGDDIPFVNTWTLRTIESMKASKAFVLGDLFKDDDDKGFVSNLFRKTMLHQHEYDEDIQSKTPNWEMDRFSDIDLILIKMGITEFLYFPSIPVRVSINEYIELAKDYSTTKSGKFINGVLDKLSKDLKEEGKLVKVGRGLI